MTDPTILITESGRRCGSCARTPFGDRTPAPIGSRADAPVASEQ